MLALSIGGIKNFRGALFEIFIILGVCGILVAACFFLVRYLLKKYAKPVSRNTDYIAHINSLPPREKGGELIRSERRLQHRNIGERRNAITEKRKEELLANEPTLSKSEVYRPDKIDKRIGKLLPPKPKLAKSGASGDISPNNALPAEQEHIEVIPSLIKEEGSWTFKPIMNVAVIDENKRWVFESTYDALCKIDWYQFEKFCSTLLSIEGYTVERKGGAHPDGGVDLIAAKDGELTLVQCKHWKTWEIKPKTVREMVGTMTINQTSKGAIYTIKGPSKAALALANEQGIQIEEGISLADRAVRQLSKDQLDNILRTNVHHCPKCEAPMVWREGNFKPFWGCKRYPRCRGKLEHTGAR